ncbi:hypothetical protein ABVK25_008611 [Lepraria finkii]|uniref:Uncharacterized protein n=1 Tax=Lepraria finkii TaxID=1340010 RepID=A0ABR4B1U5_9LECA
MDAGLDYSVHKLLDLDKWAQDRVVKYDKRQPPYCYCKQSEGQRCHRRDERDKPKTNTDEVLARLKENFVDAVLDILSNAINFLLKAISLVVQKFKELGHYEMDVPIFSAL